VEVDLDNIMAVVEVEEDLENLKVLILLTQLVH